MIRLPVYRHLRRFLLSLVGVFVQFYLSLPKGFFSRWYSLVFFSGPATITIISCSCHLWYWKEMKIGPSRKCILLMDWAVCKKTNNREGGGGGNMLLPVFSAPTFCPTFCDSQQQLHRLRVVVLLPKSYSWQAKKVKLCKKPCSSELRTRASHMCDLDLLWCKRKIRDCSQAKEHHKALWTGCLIKWLNNK